MNSLTNTMDRKVDISNAAPTRHKTLRAAVESLSLANVDGAVCELMNEAMARLVELLYQQDAGGLCNVDGATGRVLIPLPFGRNGQTKWGLRPQEANILRHILFAWGQEPTCLLRYDRTRRSWFVTLRDFGNVHLAKTWLRQHQVTIALYRAARAKVVAGT